MAGRRYDSNAFGDVVTLMPKPRRKLLARWRPRPSDDAWFLGFLLMVAAGLLAISLLVGLLWIMWTLLMTAVGATR